MGLHSCFSVEAAISSLQFFLLPSSVMIFIVFFFLGIVCDASPFSFNFTSFDASNHDIKYEGDATPLDSVIQLTKSQPDSTGHATYIEPLHLWDSESGDLADIAVSVSFSIDAANNVTHGDGLAFYMASLHYRIPDTQQGSGIGLASGNQTANSTGNPFVAVEFDTFYNYEWDDLQDDHVGIDINSLRSSKSVRWYSSVMDGRVMNATIIYSARSKTLCANFTGFKENVTIQQNLCYEVDLRLYLPEWVVVGFSAATGLNYESHTIRSWSVHSQFSKAGEGGGTKNRPWYIWLIIGAAVSAILIFGVWICTHFLKRIWQRRDQFEEETGPRKFSYKELAAATNSFSSARILGSGGFGKVYLGFLKDGSKIAVKRIQLESQHSLKSYVSEVKTINTLRHKNLVKLIGWCRHKREVLAVYELISNKSLDVYLSSRESMLTWQQRLHIALGLASALLYLQEESEQLVLHRDIKSSNVLLDLEFNAKLIDFGQARSVDHGDGARTTDLIGTEGYIAPEYGQSRKPTKESDVYSFGIVALEIACGKPAIFWGQRNGTDHEWKLVEWVWGHYGTGNIFAAADPRLAQNYVAEEMNGLIIVGLACANPNDSDRPSIRNAIEMLEGKAPLPTLPSEMPLPRNIAAHRAMAFANPAPSLHGASAPDGVEMQPPNTQSSEYNTAPSNTA